MQQGGNRWRGRGRGRGRGGYHNQQHVQNQDVRQESEVAEKEPLFAPKPSTVCWPETRPNKVLVVCYDTENAYGNELGEIYQIGATCSIGLTTNEDSFLANLLPTGIIQFGVTKFAGTHVTVKMSQDGDRYLWHTKRKETVDSVAPSEGFNRFLDWLEAKKRDAGAEKLVLIAHGSMDAPSLCNNMAHYSLLDRLTDLVDAFGDTMPYLSTKVAAAFERLHPGQRFEAHNALADADALFKVLHKKQKSTGGSTRVMFSDQIKECCVPLDDCVTSARFKVSKLAQKTDKVPKVVLLKSLVMTQSPEELAKYKFITHPKEEIERLPPPPPPQDPLDTKYVVFDAQFLHSQGPRADLVHLMAAQVDDGEVFEQACVPPGEEHLLDEATNTTADIALGRFVEWLKKTKGPIKSLVLVAYGCNYKKLPGLLNHVSFHDYDSSFRQVVNGVVDLRDLCKRDAHLAKLDSLDKLHRSLFREDIELYRPDEVCQSNRRLAQEMAKKRGISVNQLLQDDAMTLAYATHMAKKVLDESMARDIEAGTHFVPGEYKEHRIPHPSSS